LRVLVVTSSFPRFPGDPSGVFILSLCKELQKLGIELEVLAPHDDGFKRHEFLEGIEVFRFPYFYPHRFQRLCYGAGILKNMKGSPLAVAQLPFFILAELFYAIRIAQQKKFDLVHAHWSIPQGLVALFLQKVFGIPCVISLHGSDVYGLGAPLVRSLNAKVILGSNVCTANSFATAKIARRLSGRENIQIIPMGVDVEFFRQTADREALHGGLGREDKTILYAGRLIELKGVEYLIKALPEVIEKHPEAKLVVVGSGPCKKDLVSVTERLNLQDKVTFLDAVSQEELARYYSAARVFVLPSIVNDEGETEGLGVVLLEAMASGVPVIGTGVGGILDIIKDGETGLLSLEKNPNDLADKICTLLTDEDLRKKVTEKGYQLVTKEFSWDVIAKEYAGLYDTLI
jgi:glycosyltransferase involved in cell wall biosynthesis